MSVAWIGNSLESPLKDIIPLISTKLLLICAIVWKKRERKEELSSWFCTRELNSSYTVDCTECQIQLGAWRTQFVEDLVSSIVTPWEQRARWPISVGVFSLSTIWCENINNKGQPWKRKKILQKGLSHCAQVEWKCWCVSFTRQWGSSVWDLILQTPHASFALITS